MQVFDTSAFINVDVFDDDIADLIKRHTEKVVEPSEAVQKRAGFFQGQFPNPGRRNRADPFILAEAESRRFTVVTYAGTTFRGTATKNWDRTMPGVCHRFGIPCCTLAEALERLGLVL